MIYSWLPQPYGVVSQEALTFPRFEPASLQSAIQWLSLLAIEDDGQKRITFQRFEPATLQTTVQWLNLSAMEGTYPE